MPSNSEIAMPRLIKNDEFGKEIYSKLSNDRKLTVDSIKQVSSYDDLNIYEMTIYYDYNLDEVIKPWDCLPDTSQLMKHIIGCAIPGVDIPYQAPEYGCSALTCKENDEDVIKRLNKNVSDSKHHQCFMGRNYDFKFDSSAMLVRTNPKDGYKSVSFSGLDHIYDNNPLANNLTKVLTLSCPYVPLDGMNEKGVCATVLTLDSQPTIHNQGKRLLMPGTLIRLVLDKAATTTEAVKMLKDFDMFSISGRDYHYYITDASGNACAIEYDCCSKTRSMKIVPTKSITNYYKLYADKVKPNQHNDIYGHGKERDNAMCRVFDVYGGHGGKNLAWDCLKAAAQTPNHKEMTSNTQWSTIYNMTTLEFEISLHRRWENVYKFTF